MSARGNSVHHGNMQGASHHADLFESKSTRSQREEDVEKELYQEAQLLHETYGATSDAKGDPLILEHMLGCGGQFRQTVAALPTSPDHFVKSMGSLLSIEDLNNPQEQKLLRGHDMQISAVTVSPSGKYIASGQVGTKNFKGSAAPIFVWNIETGKRSFVLRGLTQRVNIIEFSEDEKFICGCGEDCLAYIWELATEEVVFGQRHTAPPSMLKFVEQRVENRKVVYQLVVGIGNSLNKGTFYMDPQRVQWTLKLSPYAFPPGGLVRTYCSAAISADKKYLYVGSSGGEMIVFRQDLGVYRAIIPICTNGIQTILILPNDEILCGGGDGSISKLIGEDLNWEIIGQTSVDGTINSLTLCSNQAEVVIGTSTGKVYRSICKNLYTNLVTQCHTSSIKALCFGSRPNIFATGTINGGIRVWDLTDYACQAMLKDTKSGSVECLHILDDTYLLSGWQQGAIRCHDLETLNRQVWYIPNAHRGGTTTIATCSDRTAKLQYLVSGGGDGAVRVWRLSNRELVAQYTEHTKAISRVLVDNQFTNLVHSVSQDCSVLTFDLQTERRKICHITKGGIMTDMTQRKDSEHELITCDTQGRLLHWDVDIRDPVLVVQDVGSKPILRTCAISPTGRFLAFAGDDSILKILNVSSSQIVSLGQGHSSVINTLAWTPDERQIVSAGEDFCVCIWNFYIGGR